MLKYTLYSTINTLKIYFDISKSIYDYSEKGLSMKVVAGEDKLCVIMDTAKKLFAIYFPDQKEGKFNSLAHVNEDFFNSIIKKPIIFHCEIGKLNGSHHSGEFKNFAEFIHYADHLESLWFLYHLPGPDQEKLNIKWVVIESTKEVKNSDLLQKLIFLDYWQVSHGKKNTSGKIDYERLESLIRNTAPKNFGKVIMKKFIKFISYPLLGVKPPQMDYLYPELRFIVSPSSIKIDDEMNNNIYRYKCIVCGMMHSVVLHRAQKKKMPSSKTMIRYDANKKRVEFICNHVKTNFEGMPNVYFMPEKVGGFELKTPESYDQAFLFLFFHYQRKEDNIVYLDEQSNRLEVSMPKYLGLDENHTV